MMSFSELEARAAEVAKSVENHAASIFHHGVADALAALQAEEAKAKAAALVAVKDATPEIKAAVEAALEVVEKAVLTAIEARLA